MYVFLVQQVTRSIHSDMVVVFLWQKQRIGHQLCPQALVMSWYPWVMMLTGLWAGNGLGGNLTQ